MPRCPALSATALFASLFLLLFCCSAQAQAPTHKQPVVGKRADKAERAIPPRTYAPPEKVTAVVTGQVHNADGTVAPGTDVWGVCSTTGYSDTWFVLHTKTDRNGTYHLTGLSIMKGDAASTDKTVFVVLLATRPNAAPTLAAVIVDREKYPAPALTFGPEATLSVTVQDTRGNPAAGVTVEAKADIYQHVLQEFGQYRNAFKGLRRALVPQAITDRNGVARFAHLRPDLYRINASSPSPDPAPPNGASGPGSASASAQGIALGADQNVQHTLRLLPFRPRLHVRYIAPDGTIVRSNYFTYRVRSAGSRGWYTASGSSSRSNVSDHFDLDLPPGVWNIEYDGDYPLAGRATVAVRSDDPEERTLDIHLAAQKVTRLNLLLLDERGVPVVGDVYKSAYGQFFSNGPEAAGTADSRGRLTLAIGSGDTVTLRAQAATDAPFPASTTPGTAFPSDNALTNRRRWPATTIKFEPGQTTSIRLQAVRVGWVRGRVQGAPEGSFTGLLQQRNDWGTKGEYHPRTGEYLVGPLPPGPIALYFDGKTGGKRETVTIVPGQVVHHDITLDPALADIWGRSWEESRKLSQTPVTVVDARNRPIPGVSVYLQGRFYGSVGGSRLTDSAGQARLSLFPWLGQWLSLDRSTAVPAPPPAIKPIWIGYIPGARGVGVVSALPGGPNAPVRLTLPPPINLSGTVTIGGKSLLHTPGQFVVYARADDETWAGKFKTIVTQPSADGTFSLCGLTPGNYRIQAMLDNTFFSPPQTVTVSDAMLPTPTLDMPTPGAPTILDLGASGAQLRVYPTAPPTGPLAEKLAPRYWSADGAGIVHLEGLTAGTHKLRLPSGEIKNIVVLLEKENL